MGWYTAALSTGYAAGARAGGALADATSRAAALGLMGALPGLFALGVLVALPRFESAPNAGVRGPGLRGLLRAHRELDPRVWLAFTIALYINVLTDSVETFYPLFGAGFGLSQTLIGFLKGLKSGSATLIRVFSGIAFRFVDHRVVNFWSVLLFGGSTLALPYVTSLPVLLVLFTGAGIARSLLRVTSAAMIADLRREGQDISLASGVYNAGLDIGAIVGPLFGGLLSDAFGIGPMFQQMTLASLAVYFVIALATPVGRATLSIARPSFARRLR